MGAAAAADIPTLVSESSQPLWLTLILWGYIVGVIIMLGLTLATIFLPFLTSFNLHVF